ncbi:MAG: radical SAM protein [Candidatus Cloacimonadaceae bacterium]|nr:radical SAM protein [Candidatus Cloacimonadota bacterium]
MKYLFGPVPSRRLGISLGVDLVPHKVCSLNCVYCEVGKTDLLTLERKEYVPINDVLAELDEFLATKPNLDFITFSGQGEPTLNSGLGRVINHVKDHYPVYKVAVLSNGTLFWDRSLRREVMRADLILPDLDAVSQDIFLRINRPKAGLDNKKVIQGLKDLRAEFPGKILMEVFLVPGLNDSPEELQLIRSELLSIAPAIVQLNSLDRPGTEDWVKAMPRDSLLRIVDYFKPLKVEIIANPQSRKTIPSFNGSIEQQILDTITRRPSTDADLCQILSLHKNELNKYLSVLLENNRITAIEMERGTFFKIKQ